MQQLTKQGRQRIAELAQRYSVSTDAVLTLLQSLVNSSGTMAQLNHRELGWRAMDAGRHDHGRRHVQLRSQGEGRGPLF